MTSRALLVASAWLALATSAGVAAAEVITIGAPARPLSIHLPPPGAAPVPIVVMSHGYLGKPGDHASMTAELPRAGLAVGLFQAPNNRDLDPHHWRDALRRDLDAIEAAAAPGGPLSGRVDTARIGLMGVSLGGGNVISTAAVDPRVKAVVALAPGVAHLPGAVFDLRSRLLREARRVTAPTLILSGSYDAIAPTRTFARPLARRIPGARHVELPRATHLNFTDNPSPGLPTPFGRLRVGLSNADQRAIAARHYVGWFQDHLGAARPTTAPSPRTRGRR